MYTLWLDKQSALEGGFPGWTHLGVILGHSWTIALT